MHPCLIALMDHLAEAQSRFEAAQSNYAALRARTRRETVRDEWYAGAHYAPCPFGLERFGMTPAKRLGEAPKDKRRANTCRYGFTRDGRICVEQQFTEFPDRAYEEFWIHADDRIDTARYDHYEPDKDPINVQTIRLEPGPGGSRAAALIRHAQRGIAIEAYEYDQTAPHRLQHIHASACEHDPASPQHAWMSTRDDFHYDAAGRLLRIDRTWIGGSTATIYPDPGE
jgi:hypothetical protein